MKVKIAIMNDRKIPMTVNIQEPCREPWDHRTIILKPAEARVIEFEIPEYTIPWFKIWETNVALLSHIADNIADHLEGA